jgi:hypothetical protein
MGKQREVIKTKDLKEMGYTDYAIRQMCRMKGSPFYQLAGLGDWRADKQEFLAWQESLAERKRAAGY